jgi:hypothetical protein
MQKDGRTGKVRLDMRRFSGMSENLASAGNRRLNVPTGSRTPVTGVFAGIGKFSDCACPFLNDGHYFFNDPGASVCFFEIIHQGLRLRNDAAGHIFQCF